MTKPFGSIAAATTVLAFLAIHTPTFAANEPENLSGSMSVAMLSQYISRGYELSKDSIVIQPSISAAYMGFGVNLWGNLDTDQNPDLYAEEGTNWNETDLTLSYDGQAGMVSYSVGYVNYFLEGDDEDTQEVYGCLGLDTLLAPLLTVYRNIDAYSGWYTTLGVSHSLQVTESITLDIGGQISYLSAHEAENIADPDDPGRAYSDFHDGVLTATFNFPLTEQVSVAPNISYSLALSDNASKVIKAASASGEDDSFIYGGIALNINL